MKTFEKCAYFVIPAKAGIHKDPEKTGFPPARE
jgi:hypothetical protein